MTTRTFKSQKEFKSMFNFSIQPDKIKFVNGIEVNISNGSLTVTALRQFAFYH